MVAGIILGIYTFLTLCLIAFLIINEWNKFKNLRPGDSCGRLVEFDSTSEIIMDDIIKVDVDEKGYTTKIYTKNNSYTFLGFIRNNIITECD